jgi:hypothetical protein
MLGKGSQDYAHQYRQYIDENWLPVMDTRPYTCGFCGRAVSSYIGLRRRERVIRPGRLDLSDPKIRVIEIRACPHCWCATTFGPKKQYPEPLLGESFSSRDKSGDVKQIVALYNEAREALSQGAPSCAVLMFRKLLMHIAVEQGAGTKLKFVEHVDHLKSQGIVGKPMHGLLDRIRRDGNEENHEVVQATPEKASDLLNLVTLLIKSVYFAG